MKYILTLAATILLFTFSKAQQANLTGTWKITNFKYGDNAESTDKDSRIKKYKLYTPTHFAVIETDSVTKITTTSIFGTYSIKDSIYTEHILNVNRESAAMIGMSFNFTIHFEGPDKLRQTGAFNGMKSAELWTRLTDPGNAGQLLQGKSTLTWNQIADGEVKSPLYFINDGGKNIALKKISISPLQIIKQNQIASLEVVKGQNALDLFGEQAKNGAIIITLKEGALEQVQNALKAHKAID